MKSKFKDQYVKRDIKSAATRFKRKGKVSLPKLKCLDDKGKEK